MYMCDIKLIITLMKLFDNLKEKNEFNPHKDADQLEIQTHMFYLFTWASGFGSLGRPKMLSEKILIFVTHP